MAHLQALRVTFVLVTLASAVFAPNAIGARVADLLTPGALYIALTAAGESTRRLSGRRGVTAVTILLLIDGLFLAWVMLKTGGVSSPLRFLVYLHVIAVTLLASHRTGLKLALWHSLLYFGVYEAQVAGWLQVTPAEGISRPSVFNLTALWVVAIGTAAFSAINERDLRRRQHELEALTAMAERLEATSDPVEIGAVILRATAEAFGFRRGVLFERHGGALELLSYVGPGEPGDMGYGVDAIVERAWAERAPLLVKRPDVATDPRLARLLPFARNLIVVPLYAEGAPSGVLVLEKGGGVAARIERRVVAMVGQFAAHGSLALHNARLLSQIQRLADTDPLTGLANRRVFEQTLRRELARAGRANEQVSLLMFDLDHFKRLNDLHGHQAGDHVLTAVARALAGACRDFDTVARYGGEEFAVIAPSCPPDEASDLGERLRAAIAAIAAPVPVTASAGVATFPLNAGDPTALIGAADEALYRSKQTGRDRLTRSWKRAPYPAPSEVTEAPERLAR
jgi:diguanylate cyclase (GGDEF)-like protein